MNTTYSVSYTHLDVYKRQVCVCVRSCFRSTSYFHILPVDSVCICKWISLSIVQLSMLLLNVFYISIVTQSALWVLYKLSYIDEWQKFSDE